MFGVHFLSFPLSMTKSYFVRILTTISGTDTTGACKLENQASMNQFCTQNIPTLFGVQFLSLPVRMAENYFGRILTTFSGPERTKVGKG